MLCLHMIQPHWIHREQEDLSVAADVAVVADAPGGPLGEAANVERREGETVGEDRGAAAAGPGRGDRGGGSGPGWTPNADLLVREG